MTIFIPLLALLTLSVPDSTRNASEPSAGPHVRVVVVDGVINPVAAEIVRTGIRRAEANADRCLVIELDTPGGLDTSMRDIVKSILNSEVPVVVYIAPSGARAASAGVFMTLAAHVAAMAPGTNLGAAHPVSVGGGKMDETMSSKVENDAAAYIRSIAERRGRNAAWAEDAVRKSVSLSETEAVKQKVVDLIATDVRDLLDQVDGRSVNVAGGPVTLHTREAKIDRVEVTLRQRLLNVLGDPNIAYLLLLLGFYGLFFELSNPGAILPGVAGGIAILLALFAFQMLPVNFAGIFLILFAMVLFLADVKVTSHGVLTVGGIVAMVIGSLMLVDVPSGILRVSGAVVLAATAATAAFFLFVVGAGIRAQRAQPTTGREGLVGATGRAMSAIDPTGLVSVHGETWRARSASPIPEGDPVRVVSVLDLTLEVVRNPT